MYKTVFIVLALVALTFCKTSISIMDFESNLGSVETSIIANKFVGDFVNSQLYTVTDKSTRDLVLTEQEFQLSGCASDACLVEVGQLIGVQQILSGSVYIIDNVYDVSLKLVDVETGLILGVVDEEYEASSILGFKAHISSIVQLLVHSQGVLTIQDTLDLTRDSLSRATLELTSMSAEISDMKSRHDSIVTGLNSSVTRMYKEIRGLRVRAGRRSERNSYSDWFSLGAGYVYQSSDLYTGNGGDFNVKFDYLNGILGTTGLQVSYIETNGPILGFDIESAYSLAFYTGIGYKFFTLSVGYSTVIYSVSGGGPTESEVVSEGDITDGGVGGSLTLILPLKIRGFINFTAGFYSYKEYTSFNAGIGFDIITR